ncbi:MAG: hypothetical protein WKF97_16245 [Chitinophagaceae bacterium]
MGKSLLALFFLLLFFDLRGQIQTILISPKQTDPLIRTIHSDHVAYIPSSVRLKNQLMLMIVGTGGSAKDLRPFDSTVASLGYHVISMDYNNSVVTTVCSESKDSTCFDSFRQEIMFGTPVNALVGVDSVNSIYNRFFKLLSYLAKNNPQQGWKQYMEMNQIQWKNIVVAGHSQGAGHAAYLAKHFPVAKLLIFAGPQDYLNQYSSPAAWLSGKNITEPSKYFAFLHTNDPYVYTKQLTNCMTLMGKVNRDTMLVKPGKAVKSSSQILVTDIATSDPHGSMFDLRFQKVWKYMLQSGLNASSKQ